MKNATIILNNREDIERSIDDINIDLLMSSSNFNIEIEEEIYNYLNQEPTETDYEKEMIEYYKYKDNQEGGYNYGNM